MWLEKIMMVSSKMPSYSIIMAEEWWQTRFESRFSQRRESAMVNGVAGHLRTHLHDLLQTHKLYLILWKDRLSNSAALLGKESSIAIVSVDSNIMQALILRLRCARLKDLTGLWFHNFLRSILKVLRLLKNICQFSTCWTSFDVLAFHDFGQNFFTAKALEILRQMLSQYRTFIQAY